MAQIPSSHDQGMRRHCSPSPAERQGEGSSGFNPTGRLVAGLVETGVAHIGAAQMRELVGPVARAEWPDFMASWNTLPACGELDDGGTCLRRRSTAFLVGGNFVWRRYRRPAQQSHERSSPDDDAGNKPTPDAEILAGNRLLHALLRLSRELIGRRQHSLLWHVEMQQFRITAGPDAPGPDTSRRLHQGDVDWVFVLAVAPVGITGTPSGIQAPAAAKSAVFALEEPFDAALFDVRQVRPGAIPVRLAGSGSPDGHRDVLVLTFKATTEWNP